MPMEKTLATTVLMQKIIKIKPLKDRQKLRWPRHLTLTATISAYPSVPPRNVVTDLFNPCKKY